MSLRASILKFFLLGTALCAWPAQAVAQGSRAPSVMPLPNGGAAPNYSAFRGIRGEFPNLGVLVPGKVFWAAGLNDKYDPQGIAFAGSHVYLSGYRWTGDADAEKSFAGKCRIFRIDPNSGAEVGHFDMPADCGHGGGLAYDGKGHLIVSDTHHLFQVQVPEGPYQGGSMGPVKATLKLGDAKSELLTGSFTDFDFSRQAVFIGTWSPARTASIGYWIPYKLFEDAAKQPDHVLTISQSKGRYPSVQLPGAYAQGAAFDRQGNIWITASRMSFGCLYKMTPGGAILASIATVAGIEDIGFDGNGMLWAVSEAGSFHFPASGTSFPALFQLDVRNVGSSPSTQYAPCLPPAGNGAQGSD